MDVRGSHRFQASQIQIWNALLDANFLQECIPNCDGVRGVDPHQLGFRAQVAIGPIKGKYPVVWQVADVQPPNHLALGFARAGAKGSVTVNATVDFVPDGTLVNYAVHADLGGIIAKIPGPMLESGAKMVLNQFCKRVERKLGEMPAAAPAPG